MIENSIEDEIEKLNKKNKDVLSDIEKNIDESTKEIKNLIKAHPLVSVGIAFAAGLLIGRALNKKD